MECGLTLDGYTDFQEDDEIECLKVVWKAPDNVILPGDSGTVRVEGKGAGSSGTGGSGSAKNSSASSNNSERSSDVQSTGKRMHAGRS